MKATFEKLIGRGRAVDPQGMIDLVSALPDQVEEGWERGGKVAADLTAGDATGILVAGMGGSAIAGDLVRSCYGADLEIPIHVVRGSAIPKAIKRNAFFVFSSYSGNTRETLDAYDTLRHDGMRAVGITSGGELHERCERDGVPVCELPQGLPPRAALGYSFAMLSRIVARAGAGPSRDDECREAVKLLRALRKRMTDAGEGNRAAALAHKLEGRYPVIYACNGLLGLAATRWATQLNENSKSLAHVAVFPELAHNEICGWDGNVGVERLAHVISLEDEEDSPFAKRLRDITIDAIEPVVGEVSRVGGEGQGRMARLLTAVMLGDYVSVYLAYLYGVDPTPVERINTLKSRLARDEQ